MRTLTTGAMLCRWSTCMPRRSRFGSPPTGNRRAARATSSSPKRRWPVPPRTREAGRDPGRKAAAEERGVAVSAGTDRRGGRRRAAEDRARSARWPAVTAGVACDDGPPGARRCGRLPQRPGGRRQARVGTAGGDHRASADRARPDARRAGRRRPLRGRRGAGRSNADPHRGGVRSGRSPAAWSSGKHGLPGDLGGARERGQALASAVAARTPPPP